MFGILKKIKTYSSLHYKFSTWPSSNLYHFFRSLKISSKTVYWRNLRRTQVYITSFLRDRQVTPIIFPFLKLLSSKTLPVTGLRFFSWFYVLRSKHDSRSSITSPNEKLRVDHAAPSLGNICAGCEIYQSTDPTDGRKAACIHMSAPMRHSTVGGELNPGCVWRLSYGGWGVVSCGRRWCVIVVVMMGVIIAVAG